jgi:hypothetical protein
MLFAVVVVAVGFTLGTAKPAAALDCYICSYEHLPSLPGDHFGYACELSGNVFFDGYADCTEQMSGHGCDMYGDSHWCYAEESPDNVAVGLDGSLTMTDRVSESIRIWAKWRGSQVAERALRVADRGEFRSCNGVLVTRRLSTKAVEATHRVTASLTI